MSAPIRKDNLDISVFTINGTDYICDMKDCSIEYQVQTEESRGVCSGNSYPWAVSDSWQLSGEIFVNSSASVFSTSFNNSMVTIVFNTGAGTYTGSAQVTSVSHVVGAAKIQTQHITMQGFGPLVLS